MVVEALLGGPPNHKNHQLHKLFGIALAQKAYIPVHSIHLLRLPLSLSENFAINSKMSKSNCFGGSETGVLGVCPSYRSFFIAGSPQCSS